MRRERPAVRKRGPPARAASSPTGESAGLAPRSLRKLYRMLRCFAPPRPSRRLPAELLRDCRVVPSRNELLSDLPGGGRIAELGTYKGEFAQQILIRCNPQELHVVDIDFARFDQRLAADRRVQCHRGWTHEVMAGFPDGYFDWVYVDADHSYEATLRDARTAAPKVRPGGYLVFNDFAHVDCDFGQYGVHRAVIDFALERRWPMAFFALSEDALYDVALRKPE
jgi:methyltransferase family protein